MQRIDLVGVLLDAVGHRLRAGECRVALGHEARARLRHAAHELRALVRTALLVVHVLLVDLEAHVLGGVLLGLLARRCAAFVADAERQVDADVAILRQQCEPRLLAHDAHAGKQHLVVLGQATERARAGHIALLVGAGRARDLVVERAGHLALREHGLGRAGRDAQAAALAGLTVDGQFGHDFRLLKND